MWLCLDIEKISIIVKNCHLLWAKILIKTEKQPSTGIIQNFYRTTKIPRAGRVDAV